MWVCGGRRDVDMSELYVRPGYAGQQSLLDAMEADDIDRLESMIIGAALYEDDFEFAQRACITLSGHAQEIVRGNAVLGFGHLARLFGRLDPEALAIVRERLRDPSDYVRGQAHSAAVDILQFLGLVIE